MTPGDYFPAEALYELAYRAAGIGSGAVMELVPGVVMPSDEISRQVRELIETEYGIEAPLGYQAD